MSNWITWWFWSTETQSSEKVEECVETTTPTADEQIPYSYDIVDSHTPAVELNPPDVDQEIDIVEPAGEWTIEKCVLHKKEIVAAEKNNKLNERPDLAPAAARNAPVQNPGKLAQLQNYFVAMGQSITENMLQEKINTLHHVTSEDKCRPASRPDWRRPEVKAIEDYFKNKNNTE